MSDMDQNISALETKLAAVTDIPEQIDLLNALAFELSHIDPQRSLELCEQARQLAAQENLSDADGLAVNRLILSIREWNVSNYQAALRLALEALSLFEKEGNTARQAYALNHMAGIHFSWATILRLSSLDRKPWRCARRSATAAWKPVS